MDECSFTTVVLLSTFMNGNISELRYFDSIILLHNISTFVL